MEKRWKTSLISVSSSPEMSFSLASLDWRVFVVLLDAVAEEVAPPRFLGGCSEDLVSLAESILMPFRALWG